MPEQSVPRVMVRVVAAHCAIVVGVPVGRGGKASQLLKKVPCCVAKVRRFLAAVGLIWKVGACGSVVWRIVLGGCGAPGDGAGVLRAGCVVGWVTGLHVWIYSAPVMGLLRIAHRHLGTLLWQCVQTWLAR